MDTIETFKPVYQRFFREWHDRSRFLQVLKLTRKPLLLLAGKNPKGSNSAKWKLYEIERKADDEQMDYGQREQLRFDLALPILHALEVWLKKEYPKVLPKSPIGKAISFALKRFNRLCRYCGDGRFQIDNNLIENGQRKVALGRKNYLFCGNNDAAEDAAIMYTVMECCRINGVDFENWLTYFLNHIHEYDNDYSRPLDELLPQNLQEKGLL